METPSFTDASWDLPLPDDDEEWMKEPNPSPQRNPAAAAAAKIKKGSSSTTTTSTIITTSTGTITTNTTTTKPSTPPLTPAPTVRASSASPPRLATATSTSASMVEAGPEASDDVSWATMVRMLEAEREKTLRWARVQESRGEATGGMYYLYDGEYAAGEGSRLWDMLEGKVRAVCCQVIVGAGFGSLIEE